MDKYRLLVTGSRNWTDKSILTHAIATILEPVWSIKMPTIVHGACPTGADMLAHNLALLFGWEIESYPADWSQGKKAGPLRNQAMVDSRPDHAVAFMSKGSRGTKDCVARCVTAGIPVYVYYPEGTVELC